MATSLSGGTLINTTFTGATKQNVTDGVETALLAAGWTTISGSGTTNCLMQSAAVTTGFQFRLRMKPSSNCCCFSIEDIDGSPAGGNGDSNGGYILPAAAKTIRVIASRYNAHIFCPTTVVRDFVSVGMVAPPANVTTITQAAYLLCNAAHDNDGTNRCSLRNSFLSYQGNDVANHQILVNGTLWENAFATGIVNAAGIPRLMCTVPGALAYNNGAQAVRYFNDDYLTWDPQFCAGVTSSSAEGKILGNIYNMTCVADTLTSDTTVTFDSKNWYVLGVSAYVNGAVPRGSILVIVP